MTLGEHIAQLTIKEVIEGKAQKSSTKRILRRCLPSLKQVVNDVASEEAGKMALPACYGRHVIFACPSRGMICDMLHWSDPADVPNESLDDRAVIWATLTGFIHRANVSAALLCLATRLGTQGIAQFEQTFARLDGMTGQVIFTGGEQDTSLTTRAALIVLSGVYEGTAGGIIGSLPVPVLSKPGAVADWHEVDWAADGNHRLLH